MGNKCNSKDQVKHQLTNDQPPQRRASSRKSKQLDQLQLQKAKANSSGEIHFLNIDWSLVQKTIPEQGLPDLQEFQNAKTADHLNRFGSNLLQVYISWARPVEPQAVRQIIQHLSQGYFDINHENSFGETALNRLASCAKSQFEVWLILIEQGSDVNTVDHMGKHIVKWYLTYNMPPNPLVLRLILRADFDVVGLSSIETFQQLKSNLQVVIIEDNLEHI